jgi:hypothetical protein
MKTRIPEQSDETGGLQPERADFRNPEQDEQDYEAKLAALLAMVDAGDACDPANDIDGEECLRRLHQRIVDRDRIGKDTRIATIKLRQTGGKEEVER